MTDILKMPEPDCVRAQAAMTRLVDGELSAGETEWLAAHAEECASCGRAWNRLTEIDRQLTAWGKNFEQEFPAPDGQRERLIDAFSEAPVRRSAVRSRGWMPAAALAVAAVLVLALLAPQGRPPAANRATAQSDSQFIEIPYVAPLDPHENATIVRMNIKVSTLLAMGFRISADPDATVQADVLVGEDGRAHAIRVISDVPVSGAGD